VLEALKDLPRDFELDRLLDKLVFMEKVEKGLIQLEQGKTTDHDKVEEMSNKW